MYFIFGDIIQQLRDFCTDFGGFAFQGAPVDKFFFIGEKYEKAIVIAKKTLALIFVIPPFERIQSFGR